MADQKHGQPYIAKYYICPAAFENLEMLRAYRCLECIILSTNDNHLKNEK